MDKHKFGFLRPKPGRHRRRQPLPRSFKDLTPSKHFNPRTFFYELIWKALLTPRTGEHVRPKFPKLTPGQVALTWIGHASFLAQFTDLNVLIDPNFANWLFLLKRKKSQLAKLGSINTFKSVNWARKEAWPIQVRATWPGVSLGNLGRTCSPVRGVKSAFQISS